MQPTINIEVNTNQLTKNSSGFVTLIILTHKVYFVNSIYSQYFQICLTLFRHHNWLLLSLNYWTLRIIK
jgi:hypothetical protein